MTVLEQSSGLLEALRGEMTPKFLATSSAQGVPNVVPLISLQPADDVPDTLFFGNFLLRKSIRNLKENLRVGILVITTELQGWILKGDFVEFQRTGPYVERQSSSSLLRYNAYTGIRNAGVIRVRSVEATFALTKMQVAREFILAKVAGFRSRRKGALVPLAARSEFAKMTAVKVLAWIDSDGYPALAPALSLQPAGESTLICWKGKQTAAPPSGVTVAANILTLDAVSYQAKGEWQGQGNVGVMRVGEVYAGGPPYPGGRIV